MAMVLQLIFHIWMDICIVDTMIMRVYMPSHTKRWINTLPAIPTLLMLLLLFLLTLITIRCPRCRPITTQIQWNAICLCCLC